MTARAAPTHVSVRALILALGRFEIASRDKARVLEKEWDIYCKHRPMTGEGNVMVQAGDLYALRLTARDPRAAAPGVLNTLEKVVEP